MSMVVLVPTRSRPESAVRLSQVFEATCTGATSLVFVVDSGDPERDAYFRRLEAAQIYEVFAPGPRGIVHPLNRASMYFSEMFPNITRIGFMGDDHLPRTRGWDSEIQNKLSELGTGFVYGNDLLQGKDLPTACFMTSDIVSTLGFMSPPDLNHLYVDNFWRDMGNAIGKLEYLPNTIIEHLHYSTGKSVEDETYQVANSAVDRDRAAYWAYVHSGEFDKDRDKLLGLLA